MRTIYRTGFPISRKGNQETWAAAGRLCLHWALNRQGIAPEYRKLVEEPPCTIPLTVIGAGHAIETRLIQKTELAYGRCGSPIHTGRGKKWMSTSNGKPRLGLQRERLV